SYHGAVWTEATRPMGPVAYIVKARTTLLRDLGPCMSPFNAFQFLQGIETLPLRMREHCRNTDAVAEFLASRIGRGVDDVIHPTTQTGETRRRADAYLTGGYGGLVGFEITGGAEAGLRFIDALQMVYHVANIGDARTLAIHPATSTHQQLSAESQLRSGVTPGYVRLSVGIEHIDDIIADIDQALAEI
ncbi:MAG: PLP-dependent transferase, partial [Gammaproteobacteria bacterium]|nr:PLP-dependent transferase [Gammaproteobacteria bacterium]